MTTISKALMHILYHNAWVTNNQGLNYPHVSGIRESPLKLAQASLTTLRGAGTLRLLLAPLEIGAGEENRTPVSTLGRSRSAIEPHPHVPISNGTWETVVYSI